MSRSDLGNFRSAPALLAFGMTFILGLGADLWTKELAFQQLAPYGVIHNTSVTPSRHQVDHGPNNNPIIVPVAEGWLHFMAMVNEGAVFGIGQGQRWLFVTVSVLAIGFISYLFATSGNHRFYQFVLGMLLAGVIGNMYDRITFGYVRDMIYALPGRTWPGTSREIFPWIFNVADMLLCVGVGLIFVYTLRGAPSTRDRKGEEAKVESAA
ncbi:signal peptidase II [Humisphaera borealis]|uniref:Lipoprotein signal peptidase n=1 Tax=Humisphaera borealis TaxID=2807512 RepID=A0A7M2X3E0_9BACT|nr:signal peptidase II [Humisphaera borealis]QOV92194.1 signal peptidase II [Humisphaera borealis]